MDNGDENPESRGRHLVVELFFDPATEMAIREIWRSLANIVVLEGSPWHGARPHVTLTTYQRLDVARFRSAFVAFASETRPRDVMVESWGVFLNRECTVFLAPVITRDLLMLHQDFHQRFAAFGTALPYYVPGNWVPHCTLATGFPSPFLPRVAEVCHRVVRPMRARFVGIGLVEYGPRDEHLALSLGTRSTNSNVADHSEDAKE